jgi:hypothetical protein
MAPEPISTVYFINPSHQSVCLYVYPLLVARYRLRKSVTAATYARPTIEELLNASFSMPSVSYQRKVVISSSQNFLFIKSGTMINENLKESLFCVQDI